MASGQAVLVVSVVLMVVDGLVTWWGMRNGFVEVNPFLRRVMKSGGATGLLATRAAALVLLLLLFEMLSGGEWVLFGSMFSLVLGLVLLIDLAKLRQQT